MRKNVFPPPEHTVLGVPSDLIPVAALIMSVFMIKYVGDYYQIASDELLYTYVTVVAITIAAAYRISCFFHLTDADRESCQSFWREDAAGRIVPAENGFYRRSELFCPPKTWCYVIMYTKNNDGGFIHRFVVRFDTKPPPEQILILLRWVRGLQNGLSRAPLPPMVYGYSVGSPHIWW